MKKIGMALAGLLAALAPLTASAAEVQSGAFIFMSDETCRPVAQANCYLNNELEARKVVNALADRGVTRFLLPHTQDISQLDLIAQVIKDRGLSFYTYEGWHWWSADPDNFGYSTCETYTAGRIAPLVAFKRKYGDAFAGLHFLDEPPLPELGRMKTLAQCVRADPVLAQMKIFINLIPIYGNDNRFAGIENGKAMSPDQYGVDCALGRITNRTLTDKMVSRYSEYVRDIAENVAPTYLALNLYPFDQQMKGCPAARDLVLSENMSIISHAARIRGQVPVMYSQNFMTIPPAGEDQPQHAGFNELRWAASWFYVFGGQGTANFVSHDFDNRIGLLNRNNVPNQLAAEQSDLNSFAAPSQRELSKHPFNGFVSQFLGVNNGPLIASVSNDQILVGQYGSVADNEAMLFVAKHDPYANANSLIVLSKAWAKIERYDFNSGLWLTVAGNSNQFNVALSDFPGSLYRMSP